MAVMQKIKDANNIRHGDTVADVNKQGTILKLLRAISNGAVSGTLNSRLRSS